MSGKLIFGVKYWRNWLLIFLLSIGLIIFLIEYLGVFRLPLTTVTAFEAIPSNTAIILEFKNFNQAKQKLSKKPYTQTFAAVLPVQKLDQDLTIIDTILHLSQEYQDLLNESRLITAVQPNGAEDFDYLYIFDQYEKKFELKAFIKSLELQQVKRSVFRDLELYEIALPSGENMIFSTYEGLIIVSSYAFLVEYAIEQLNNISTNITRNSDFNQVQKVSGNGGDMSIYINFKELSALGSVFVNNDKKKDLKLLSLLGSWSGIDIKFIANTFLLSGYINGEDGNELFKGLLKESNTIKPNVIEILPDNTAILLSIGTSKAKRLLKALGNEHTNFQKYFMPWVDNELAYIITEPKGINFNSDKFFILKTKNDKLTEESLNAYANNVGELETIPYNNYIIKRIMANDIALPVFGEALNDIHNPYYTIIENYVVFANSSAALKLWIDKHLFGQTLARDVNYLQFTENLAQETNLYTYINIQYLFQVAKAYLKDTYQQDLNKDIERWQTISPIAIQATPNDKMLFVNITTKQSPNVKTYQPSKQASISWKTELSGKPSISPVLVKNHNNKQWEIFTQDENNRIYLIDKSGKILWDKMIDGQILSTIHQIDYYKNNKLQYLFNTQNKIYLVDRLGRNVKGFPKKLGYPATNGIFVVDYDGRKDYRMFVACNNGGIYGYEKNGKPLEGWKPNKGFGIVQEPLQHFLYDKKDYLLALNKAGKFFLIARNGKLRTKTAQLKPNFLSNFSYDFSLKSPRIVAVNNKGTAHIINTKGKHFKLNLKTGNNQQTKFLYEDIVGDKKKDYVVLSDNDLTVYTYEGKDLKKAFTYQYDIPQDDLFFIKLNGNSKKYIGSINKAKQRIQLIDNKGQLHPNFPLSGSSSFCITELFGDKKQAIIVAKNHSICTYKLE